MKLKSIILVVLLLSVACTQENPEIIQVFWQLDNVEMDNSSFTKKLNLYLQMKNENAFEDMDKIYLINDENEIYWEINTRNASLVNKNNEFWIGSPDIRMSEIDPGEEFPQGRYRVLFHDIRAYRAEKDVYIKKTDFKRTVPDVKVEKDFYEISYTKTPYYVRIYDSKDNILQIKKVSSKIFELNKKDADIINDAEYFRIYFFDTLNGEGIISKKYSVQ